MADTTVTVVGQSMQYSTAVCIALFMAGVFAFCVSLVTRINRIRKEAQLSGISLDERGFATKSMRRLLIVITVIDLIALWQFSVRIFNGPRLLYGEVVSAQQMAQASQWAWAALLLITILGSAIAWIAKPNMLAHRNH